MASEEERKRAQAARDTGHPEWVGFPATPREAKRRDHKHYFTGKPCARRHVSLRRVSDGRCVECVGRRSSFDAWAQRFETLRERIEQDGVLYFLDRHGSMRRTTRSVGALPGLREACEQAAVQTAMDGQVRWVVPGSGRWVVEPSRRG